LRKVLAGVLCAIAAAAPAVAFAATDEHDTGSVNSNPAPHGSDESVQLRQEATQKLRTALQRAKHKRAVAIKRKREKRLAAGTTAAGGSSASPQLQAIAACESGGNPSAIGGGGAYRGKYQFDYGTWASVGGSGDPAAAPEAEQDARAAELLSRSGTNPWPVCGQ
jgi:Transglycosylase-like domain